MYYPYYRGKQYELISIRESSKVFHEAGICCVIEPVKEKLSSLEKCLDVLMRDNNEFIVIVNPKFGDFKNDNSKLFELLEGKYKSYEGLNFGYLIDSESNILDIEDFLRNYPTYKKTIIHNDFPKGKELAEKIKDEHNVVKHLFVEGASSRLYQKHFSKEGVLKVLLSDGFTKRKNKEHPKDEHFSDLNVTYSEIGFDGFGDYLIVGDDYSETGGPAYAIAIHITYKGDEGEVRIMHFKSDRSESPVDPAGKFLEALQHLKNAIDEEGSKILKTKSIEEFISLYEKAHFPGLGYVKKLAMNHHVELIADLIKNQ